jgi:hypothetical protein
MIHPSGIRQRAHQFVLIGLVVAATFGMGFYGVLRPGPKAGEAADVVAERLRAVPQKIDSWRGVDKSVSANALRVAEAEAFLSREYSHETTREAVAVLVLYGEPGALSAHTPEVCYAGLGFSLCGAATKRSFAEQEVGEPTELWFGRFERSNGQEAVEVYWGWGTDGVWYAANNPRFAFANHRMIYKLYVQRSVRGESLSSTIEPVRSTFLPPFLRALRVAMTGTVR